MEKSTFSNAVLGKITKSFIALDVRRTLFLVMTVIKRFNVWKITISKTHDVLSSFLSIIIPIRKEIDQHKCLIMLNKINYLVRWNLITLEDDC